MEKKKHTVSVFTEYRTELLTRVAFVFTRRKINMQSVNALEIENSGLYKYDFVVCESEETIRKVSQQIEKQIDVLSVNVQLGDKRLESAKSLNELVY